MIFFYKKINSKLTFIRQEKQISVSNRWKAIKTLVFVYKEIYYQKNLISFWELLCKNQIHFFQVT